MTVDMCFEMVLVAEFLLAYFTFKFLYARVPGHVSTQVAAIFEAFAANLTGIRRYVRSITLLAVATKIASGGKHPAALNTDNIFASLK